MKKEKPFDCVEMKIAIYAELDRQNQGLGQAEIARRRRVWLETSDSPVAKWWRSIPSARQESATK